jgi:multidrug resistance efflux pump
MDKPRANPKKKRRPLYIAATIVVAALITLGLSQLKPAPPSVDAAVVWRDTVERGPMIRQVGGPGTLIPVEIRIIPAVTAGRVDEIFARPGTPVQPGTRLMRLTNPDVQLQLLEAERQLSNAGTGLVTLQVNLESQRLNQASQLATVQNQYNEAQRQAKANEELLRKSLIPANVAATTRDQLKELEERLNLEKQRLDVVTKNIQNQIDSQKREVERLTQIVHFRRNELESMNVVAGTDGVLQRLGPGDLEIGQWVNSGFELARVVKPGRLKAVLRIPETQAVDVAIGQVAHIDTRNGIVDGIVRRIDPAAQNGTVGVDVELPDQLPPGARPDLSVDGKIEIERLPDVLHVGRPQFGNANSTIGLFKLEPDGKTAVRVTVQLGQSSVNEIVIRQGLNEGDIVILSEMSQFDGHDRVRLR